MSHWVLNSTLSTNSELYQRHLKAQCGKLEVFAFHGLSLLAVHPASVPSLVNCSLSCILLDWSCQNSIKLGCILYPPQNGGLGMSSVPSYCASSVEYWSRSTYMKARESHTHRQVIVRYRCKKIIEKYHREVRRATLGDEGQASPPSQQHGQHTYLHQHHVKFTNTTAHHTHDVAQQPLEIRCTSIRVLGNAPHESCSNIRI